MPNLLRLNSDELFSLAPSCALGGAIIGCGLYIGLFTTLIVPKINSAKFNEETTLTITIAAGIIGSITSAIATSILTGTMVSGAGLIHSFFSRNTPVSDSKGKEIGADLELSI